MPLEGDAERILLSVEQGLNVGLIAAFDLAFCDAGERVAGVLARADLEGFDHVPVRRNDDIVGLLDKTRLGDADGKLAGEAMDPLRGHMLISAEAGILSFVEDAGERPYRLVLRGGRVDGIVTLSDLQKLPVRPAIFMLVTHLELLMLAWLREQRRRMSEDEIVSRLSPGRREKVLGEWERLKEDNLAIDRLSATQMCDKRELLLKLGFPVEGKGAAKEQLKGIERLRDSVAHAGDYALTREKARETVLVVGETRRWIRRLEEKLGKEAHREGGN